MYTADKIHNDILTLQSIIDQWRRQGKKTVFTNGCFDLVHLGHVDYLEKSRNLGDKLIVGLNTDASIKSNKGTNRPITDQTSRARVLAAMQFVDAVIFFNEDTPYNLIKAISPNILVKGKDYSIENIVGADFVISNGGKVETIDLVSGYSTSNIISKILNNNSSM